MRLKKILLGSAAVFMGAGVASVPATAADPPDTNGLVTTMANYLESCSNGAGIQLDRTCWTISGRVVFEARDGHRYHWGYGPDDVEETFDPLDRANDGTNVPTDDYDPGPPIDPDPEGDDTDDTTYTGIDPYNGFNTTVTMGMRFTWTANAYDVTVNFPDPFRDLSRVSVEIEQAGGLWFFIQNGRVSGSRSQIEFGAPAGPLNWWVGLDDVGAVSPVDFTFGFDVALGDFGFEAAVMLPNLFTGFDPTFEAELTGDVGPIGFDIDFATRNWGAGGLQPTLDVRLMAGFGPLSLTGYVGWEWDGGGDTDRAIGAEAEVEFGDNTLTVGVLHGEAGHGPDGDEDDRWGFGPSNPFPYLGLDEGDSFYAIWGGFERDWSPRHTTAFDVIFANSKDGLLMQPDWGDEDNPIIGDTYACGTGDCRTLRTTFTHTWRPVEGDVSVRSRLYADNALGSPHGWALGFDVTLTVPLFP